MANKVDYSTMLSAVVLGYVVERAKLLKEPRGVPATLIVYKGDWCRAAQAPLP